MVNVLDFLFGKLLAPKRTMFMPKKRSPIPMTISVEGQKKPKIKVPALVVPNYAQLLGPDGKIINKMLYNLLYRGTPHGTEQRIRTIVMYHCREEGIECTTDTEGNLYFSIGNNEDHGTMFSCHMDTVHKTDDPNDLYISTGPNPPDRDFVFAWKNGQRQILGADDKLGCYIMLRMMQKKIPGLYIYHVGEERGGKGSKYIVENTPLIVKDIKRAVAFDRMYYGDVITSQRSGVCCSDKFAQELSEKLNISVKSVLLGHELQDKRYMFSTNTGIFTDTDVYRHLIPECTNISVGYFDQHSRDENFDLYWLEQVLIPACLEMKWSELGTYQTCPEKYTYPASYHHGYVSGQQSKWWDKAETADNPGSRVSAVQQSPGYMYKDLPVYAKNHPDRTMLEMISDLTQVTHAAILKWTFRFTSDQYDQVRMAAKMFQNLLIENIRLRTEIEDLKKIHESKVTEWQVCENSLATALEKVYDYVQHMKSIQYERYLTKEMEELSDEYEEYYTSAEIPEEKKEEKDFLKGWEQSQENPILDKQDGIIKDEIKFNSDTFELTINGVSVPLYSKSDKVLQPKHFHLLIPNTRLYAHIGSQRILVHTVTGNEKLQQDAKKGKSNG